jgi:hypothetical protein
MSFVIFSTSLSIRARPKKNHNPTGGYQIKEEKKKDFMSSMKNNNIYSKSSTTTKRNVCNMYYEMCFPLPDKYIKQMCVDGNAKQNRREKKTYISAKSETQRNK